MPPVPKLKSMPLPPNVTPYASMNDIQPAVDRIVLPDDAVPVEYDLDFDVDIPRHRFDGSVKILYSVEVATNELHLHARELTGFLGITFEVDS